MTLSGNPPRKSARAHHGHLCRARAHRVDAKSQDTRGRRHSVKNPAHHPYIIRAEGSSMRYLALASCSLMAQLDRRGAAGSQTPPAAQPRIEQVSHGITQHVETVHHDRQAQPGPQRQPRRLLHEPPPLPAEHPAPARDLDGQPEAEKAQAGLGQDDTADVDAEDDDQGQSRPGRRQPWQRWVLSLRLIRIHSHPKPAAIVAHARPAVKWPRSPCSELPYHADEGTVKRPDASVGRSGCLARRTRQTHS